MINTINKPLKEIGGLTAGQVSEWLSLHLAEELRWVEDLCEVEDLFLEQPQHAMARKSFLVATMDCIAACFLLKSKGFLSITAPYYSKEGLISQMRDDWGNTYLIKEERNYQFDLSI